MERHQAAVEVAAGTVTSKIGIGLTHGGAATTLFGYFTVNELAAVVGIACSIAGVILTGYWKWRHYQLERERLEWDKRRTERRKGERRGDPHSEEPSQ